MKSIKQLRRERRKAKKVERVKYGGKHRGVAATVVRYHQGWLYDKLRHSVLTASQLSERDKAMVEATLKSITIGPEALTLPGKVPGWSVERVGLSENVFLIKWNNIEVSLLIKRQLTVIVPEPGDKMPEGVLQDPADAWQRMDLFGPSAKRSNIVNKNYHDRLEDEAALLKRHNETLDDLNWKLEKENKALTEKVESLESAVKEARKAQATNTTKKRPKTPPGRPKRPESGPKKRPKRPKSRRKP